MELKSWVLSSLYFCLTWVQRGKKRMELEIKRFQVPPNDSSQIGRVSSTSQLGNQTFKNKKKKGKYHSNLQGGNLGVAASIAVATTSIGPEKGAAGLAFDRPFF